VSGPELHRLAIEVSDLDAWVEQFERLLGRGFERHTVQQKTGPVDIAIHPAGVELLHNPDAEAPRLRSFHLATADFDGALGVVGDLGWTRLDSFSLHGRRHEVVDAGGLRLVLLEALGI